MRHWQRIAAFAAFSAVFAAAAAFVFDGAWAVGKVPVMPDCQTSFPADWALDRFRQWLSDGKFVPFDAVELIGSPYFWVELRYVSAAYFAALGMAYFLRGRGLGRAASFASGLFLAFSGYWLTLFSAGHLGWFRWMTYGTFAFGLADRALAKGRLRHWLLLGAVVAWGGFYQPDLWFLFTVFTFFYYLYRSIRVRPGWRRWICGGVVSLAVFAVIALPSIRNAAVFDMAIREKQIDNGETLSSRDASNDDGVQRRWIFVTNWSMPPEDTLEFAVPRIHGDTSCPMTLAIGNMRGNGVKEYSGRLGRPDGAESGNYRQHSLYVGRVTCLLALAGIGFGLFRRGPRRADVAFFVAFAIVFWIFSMGRYVPFVYRYVVFPLPLGDSIRAPVKWHHLTEFCIVALAGFGFQFLWEAASRLKSRATPARAALVALAVLGVADLARNDALYCAPHSADTAVAPVPQPVPRNPAGARAFYQAVRSYGLVPVGRSSWCGETILWVEQKTPPPPLRTEKELPPLEGWPRIAAFASAGATVLLCAFVLASACSRKLDGLKI